MFHTSKATRISLLILGLIVGLAGYLWMEVAKEYGSGLNFTLVTEAGVTRVYEGSVETPVFVGTEAEALRYTEAQRRANTNLTGPWVTIGAGALIVILALASKRPAEGFNINDGTIST